jgi:hypothetical protein
MTIKNMLLSVSLISSLGVFSINAFANEKVTKMGEESGSPQMTQKDVAKKFTRGESFIQGGVTYTVYPELKADFNKSKKESSSNGNKSGSVISTKSFTIYSVTSREKEDLSSNGKQVVLNGSTESFGILSGVIIVKTKNNSSFEDSSLELVKSYPNLGYFLIRIPNNAKIQDTISKIKKNQSVEETTVEVLENFKEPL